MEEKINAEKQTAMFQLKLLEAFLFVARNTHEIPSDGTDKHLSGVTHTSSHKCQHETRKASLQL